MTELNKSYIYKLVILFLLLSGAAGTGCGYKFSGGGTLPAGTGTVCIKLFNNRSSEQMFENTLANDLIYEFTRNGQKTVSEEGAADSVLSGEIKSVTSETVTHTDELTSVESRVTVVLKVQLISGGNILWENNNITDSEVYTLDTDDNSQDSAAKKEALGELSERVAAKVYSGMTENF